ncbi:MAG: sigma-70 family RNA polymerase sigma factor [Clostridiales bacterium]|jgi:RNA polymerase sigma-70 factor (ECF subfamily)|nr:sigma-70 family RNA polymerase sigma factor [Clostridiales bacterium]
MDKYEGKTDYELILATTGGEVAAFDELLARYKNLVYSVVLRMVNCREDANDQAQEVFIKIYKNLKKYKPDYKFSTWVIRIATNHVIDFRRRGSAAAETYELEAAAAVAVADSPEEAYLAKEQSQILTDAIESLPDMYKLPIVLYHSQGLSYQEISEIVDEPMSKVKNRLFRARKLLKESLMTLKRGESYV